MEPRTTDPTKSPKSTGANSSALQHDDGVDLGSDSRTRTGTGSSSCCFATVYLSSFVSWINPTIPLGALRI
ncbi:hypothetical protein KP509_24G048400 [Ceratopteris richardii]|uniref:Uncharacterized protein n=1 Tax=Ceratopteris richardii TaxID=49495 RepID=A0A8T2RX91_CERRI|nr:hypothetical protein KP509_24G048400 [Ceratopteris richardii]